MHTYPGKQVGPVSHPIGGIPVWCSLPPALTHLGPPTSWYPARRGRRPPRVARFGPAPPRGFDLVIGLPPDGGAPTTGQKAEYAAVPPAR